MSAIAAATTRLRVIGAAIIAPLLTPCCWPSTRDARLLSEGRSSCSRRSAGSGGIRRLAFRSTSAGRCWTSICRLGTPLAESPATYEGEHYRFRDIYLEPTVRRNGPPLWFVGSA